MDAKRKDRLDSDATTLENGSDVSTFQRNESNSTASTERADSSGAKMAEAVARAADRAATGDAEASPALRASASHDARWHCLPLDHVLTALGAPGAQGLSASEAAARLVQVGPNAIREEARRSPARMLAGQFADFMIGVLIVAAVISALIGEPEDSVVILVIVVLNAIIGFIQEYRAERAMEALKRLAAGVARVVRDGAVAEIAAAQLVPGDTVLLESGNFVPADLRLVESAMLRIEEAALTGESIPVDKDTAALADGEIALGDRRNMAYKGTTVVYGRGRGIVIATGMQTELGKIASLLSGKPEGKTPLQRRLTDFGKRISIACVLVCLAIFALGILRGEPLTLMFLTAVSLAVAAIPEALPAVITTALALGAYRMVKKNALIRRLPAVETLGSVTCICSDKTGTLTENRMRVEEIVVAGHRFAPADRDAPAASERHLLFSAMALNNDAVADGASGPTGDPTEVALLVAARTAGFEKDALHADMPRVAELPFDSDRKCMTTVHRTGDAIVAFTKGAPEKLINRCNAMWDNGVAAPIDAQRSLAEAERMAANGLRVIAVAFRSLPECPALLTPASIEADLTLLGLVGIMDPPRAEVFEAVTQCKSAGIAPVMVTGDHPETARAIALRLGIVSPGGRVVTGQQLEQSFADGLRPGKDVAVYARVTPAQKIAIVESLQGAGECVAMTGDGVNDAPALKRADIGVAMGRIGTDVAREASSMVLLDDNFASIVAAVREGRRIYDNIRKFVRFVMGGNAGEIWTIAAAPLFGLPLPLLPIQILWVNLVTDGLPGIALALEPEEKRIMQRPPRPANESIFARGLWQHILWVGILVGAICIAIQAWAMANGSAQWQTMVFTALAFCQMYHVLAIRSERESTRAIGLLSNVPLLGAVLLTVSLQLALIYIPALNPIFNTGPLSAAELAIAALAPALVFVGVEIEKWMVRKGWIYREQPREAQLREGGAQSTQA